MQNWLDENLQQEIKKVFEPRYKRALTNDEVATIAINLTNLMEGYFKWKWREKHEKKFSY